MLICKLIYVIYSPFVLNHETNTLIFRVITSLLHTNPAAMDALKATTAPLDHYQQQVVLLVPIVRLIHQLF